MMFYILFVVILLFVAQWTWKRRHFIELSRKCPSGPSWWYIVVTGIKCMGDTARIYECTMDVFTTHGELFCAWFGPNLMYGITSPDLCKIVLTSSKAMDKLFLFDLLKPAFGDGLLTAPAATWRIHKKIISPAFGTNIVNNFVGVFSKLSMQLIEELRMYENKKIFDLGHLLNNFTLKLFCETAIGLDGDQGIKIKHSEIGRCIKRLTQITFIRMSNIFYHSNYFFNCTKIGFEQKKLIKNLHNLTDEIIKTKRAEFIKQTQGNSLCKENTKPKAFLEWLIEISENDKTLTDDEIFQEVVTFIFAGSDTLSTTLGFILCMLGMHSDIQDEVYHEVLNNLGSYRVVNPEDFSRMKFLERVIKETLRLFPAAPLVGRQITEDLILNDEITIPTGSTAVISIIHIHRNPKYYKNPLLFDPDRFLQREIDKSGLSYTYLPFSRGPRQCIGQNYAMNALKTIISMLIMKFQFFTEYKSVEDVRLESDLLLKPKDGYKVFFKPRS